MGASGTTVVAGAPEAPGDQEAGAAYVFTEPADGWSGEQRQATKLTASEGDSNSLGFSVAVSGATVVAGAPAARAETGNVYVFTEPSGGWSKAHQHQAARLNARFTTKFLGFSVAVSGTTLLAVSPDGPAGGAAAVFTETRGGWTDNAKKLTTADGDAEDRLESVAVSGTTAGRTVVAGAPQAAIGPSREQGAAYVFSSSPQWHSHGKPIKEGEVVSVATSGRLTFHLGGEAGAPTFGCEVSDSETIENPLGGGAGTDKMTAFALSGCTKPGTLCSKGEKLEVDADPPWNTRLLSGQAIRDEIAGIELRVVCKSGELERVVDILTGSLTPAVGASVLKFGSGSGELSESASGGKATVTGMDKMKGPPEYVRITAKEG